MKPIKLRKQLPDYARYTSIAFQMLVIILLGAFGGLRLDDWAGFHFPVFTLLLTVSAVIISIYLVTKDLMRKPPK